MNMAESSKESCGSKEGCFTNDENDGFSSNIYNVHVF
jgi:hypothetical protein